MQHVDNHMDDLFRKAAESYPLKTEANGWDRITGAALNGKGIIGSGKEKPIRKYRWLIVFLFLTPLITVSLIHYQNHAGNAHYENVRGSKSISIAAEELRAAVVTTQSTSTNFYNTKSKDILVITGLKNVAHIKSVYKQLRKKEKYPLFIYSDSEEIKNAGSDFPQVSLLKSNAKEFVVPVKSMLNDMLGLKSASISKIKMPVANGSTYEKEMIARDKIKKDLQNGIYFGIMAGPQFSQVKAQGFSKTGFDAGVFAGYRFNNRIAVEGGALYASRYYFSEGKYFDMLKAAAFMPSNMQLVNLKSRTNILEIQAKMKFDIISGRKSNWFVSPGISSYILTKETNDYVAMVSGQQQKLHGVYNDNHGYLLSAFSISFGNEFKIGKHAALRIEPYLQLPLKGMGIGLMPVSAAGLHLAFVFPTNK